MSSRKSTVSTFTAPAFAAPSAPIAAIAAAMSAPALFVAAAIAPRFAPFAFIPLAAACAAAIAAALDVPAADPAFFPIAPEMAAPAALDIPPGPPIAPSAPAAAAPMVPRIFPVALAAAPEAAVDAVVAATPPTPRDLTAASSPAFAHGPVPVATDTTAAPGTTVQATLVAAPFAASWTALFPATCFALLTRPPNRLFFFGAAESVADESTGA